MRHGFRIAALALVAVLLCGALAEPGELSPVVEAATEECAFVEEAPESVELPAEEQDAGEAFAPLEPDGELLAEEVMEGPEAIEVALSEAMEGAEGGEGSGDPPDDPPTPPLDEPDPAPASRVELSTDMLTLGVGEGFRLAGTAEDAAGAPMELAYGSSRPKVVSVSASGKLKAKAKGTARITATAADGTSAECVVKVLPAPAKVKVSPVRVTLGYDAAQALGMSRRLKAKLPKGSASRVTYRTSNAAVATVDAQGRVTAAGVGRAKITAKTFNGKTAVCEVTVLPAPTSLRLNRTALRLGAGDTFQLSTELPKKTCARLTYSAEDVSVAAVDRAAGVLTAMAPGETTVTVRAFNGVEEICAVTVLPAPDGLSLSEQARTVGVGERFALAAVPTLESGEETASTVTFKSSRKRTASVSGKGVVKAKAAGKVKITARTHNGIPAVCLVTVLRKPKSVKLDRATLVIDQGGTAKLKAVFPSGQGGGHGFTSSRPDVAEVDPATGEVTARSTGRATVTVETYNGRKASCVVRVVAPAESLEAAPELSVGLYRKVKLSPAGIAKYSGGKVYGLKPGVATLTVMASGLSSTCVVTVRTWREDHRLVSVAHRGGAAYWPENTLKAFRGSAKMGVDAIELDVHTTKDGVQLVHHDAFIPAEDGDLRITQCTLKQLRGAKPDLCTLEEALKYISGTKVNLALELKGSANAAECMKLVRRYGMRKRTIYISFSDGLLSEVRRLDGSAKIAYVFDEEDEAVKRVFRTLKPDAMMLQYVNLSQAQVERWHKAGCKVGVWTVNSRKDIRRMEALGVDYITGDYPDRIQAVQ